MAHHLVYGLDIETGYASDEAALSEAETPHLADPSQTVTTRVVLSTAAGDEVFDGDEIELLTALDTKLARLAPGIVATWNGSGFDLPYLADRAGICGVRLGLHLAADRRIRTRSETLPGHGCTYRAAWYDHRHLDAALLYRSGRRPLIDVDELLRAIRLPVRIRNTTGPADLPGEELTHDAAHAFATNDARLVRSMVEARLPSVSRHVDRITVPTTEHRPAVPVARLAEPTRRIPLSTAHPAVRAALAANGG